MIIHNFRATGTQRIQRRLAELDKEIGGKRTPNGYPVSVGVYFEMKPTNEYDPLAIGIYREDNDEFLGWVPRFKAYGSDELNMDREEIRVGLFVGDVHAIARPIGGRDGKAYGLLVEWFILGTEIPDKDADAPTETWDKPTLPNTEQKPKRKGKEYKELLVKVKRHHNARLTYHELEALKERRVG